MPCYLAYGLHVRADVELADLLPCGRRDIVTAHGATEVVFNPGAAAERIAAGEWTSHPRWRDNRRHDPVVSGVRIEQDRCTGDLSMQYTDDTRFVVRADGGTVHVLAPPGMSVMSASTYLVNAVLAVVLRLRGVTCLHAATVAVPGGAVAFTGPSGAGKSTLAWSLDRQGYAVLTDDVSALVPGAEPAVSPGYPRVRLWPWTVEGLLGAADALPPVCEDWEKRYATTSGFLPDPVPLRAICVLDGPAPSVSVEPLAGPQALVALMNNVYLDYLLDSADRRRDFEILSTLTSTVPVLRVRRPYALDQAEDVAVELVDAVTAATGAAAVGGVS